jgi:hypothetical protein
MMWFCVGFQVVFVGYFISNDHRMFIEIQTYSFSKEPKAFPEFCRWCGLKRSNGYWLAFHYKRKRLSAPYSVLEMASGINFTFGHLVCDVFSTSRPTLTVFPFIIANGVALASSLHALVAYVYEFVRRFRLTSQWARRFISLACKWRISENKVLRGRIDFFKTALYENT